MTASKYIVPLADGAPADEMRRCPCCGEMREFITLGSGVEVIGCPLVEVGRPMMFPAAPHMASPKVKRHGSKR